MKQFLFKNRYVLLALGALTAVLLYIFGAHHGVDGVLAAELAAVALTAEESEGLSDAEKKTLLAIKKSVATQLADARKGLITKQDLEASLKDIKDQIGDGNFDKITEALKAQGLEIGKITEQLKNRNDKAANPFEIFRKQLEESRDELEAIKRNKSGQIAFTIKEADVTSTSGENPSVVNDEDMSAASLIRLGTGPVYAQDRATPFILDFVNVGRTNQSAYLWFDELPKEGDFAVTAEGDLKPLVQYKWERRTADYQKAAGYTVITEEFDKDFPGLVSEIKRLMQVDCLNEMNDIILSDMITSASSYSLPAMNGKIANPDRYAAIGAALAQIQSINGRPNILVLNPVDAWIMKLEKASDGHYIMPPFSWNGQTYEFGRVIADSRVAVGKFFIGDGSVYNVRLRGDIIVRIGYANDDFLRNQYSLVVEQFFYNYISTARRRNLIYGDFAAIQALLDSEIEDGGGNGDGNGGDDGGGGGV